MSRRRVVYLPAVIGESLIPSRPDPTYPEYRELRADAEAAAAADGGMVDPVKLHRRRELRRSWEWQVAVLGHDHLVETLTEMHMILLAAKRNLNPPLPQWLLAARAESATRDAERAERRKAHEERDQTASDAAVEACAVGVTVQRNGTARVRGGYVHHLGHLVPDVDVLSGPDRRPRRHRAGRGLCETEGRAKPLDLSGGEGGPATCVSCLAWSAKVRPV